jgi:hypothetical protein
MLKLLKFTEKSWTENRPGSECFPFKFNVRADNTFTNLRSQNKQVQAWRSISWLHRQHTKRNPIRDLVVLCWIVWLGTVSVPPFPLPLFRFNLQPQDRRLCWQQQWTYVTRSYVGCSLITTAITFSSLFKTFRPRRWRQYILPKHL